MDQKNSEVTPFGQGSPRSLPMKIVVCGLGRTGTASMKAALEILGFRTYHAFDLWVDSEENVERWNHAMTVKYQGKGTFDRREWDHILGQYSGVVDAPAAFFAVEIAEAYPEAKVIVLNRDPESWFRSCQAAFTHRNSVLLLIFRILFFWDSRTLALGRHMNRKQDEIWGFEWHEPGAKEKAIPFFHEYYADCRARIPAERRIEFKVQDGWEPLCAHLGVDIPTVSVGEDGERVVVPFPRTNEAAEFQRRVGKMRSTALKQAMWGWLNRIVVTGATGYFIYRILGPRLGRH